MDMHPISLMRATPPAVGILGSAVHAALADAGATREDYIELFRQHRFDGTPSDKEAASTWLSQRLGTQAAVDRIIVTNGTMNSLLLLMATLLGPDAVLATEMLTFPQVKSIASLFNIEVVGVAMDEDGLIPDELEALCASRRKPKALYCIPCIQSPTAITLSPGRRREIAEVARRHGVLIFEDEAQALYAQDAPAPIATLAPELTWYLMGLSKYLSLGVRAAFLVAPGSGDAQTFLSRVRSISSWHAAPLVASVVMKWIQTGVAQRIFAAARTEIHARQALVQSVLSGLPGFRASRGLHFWLRAPSQCSGATFAQEARAAGILVRPSELYQVNTTSHSAATIVHGVRPAIGDPANEQELLQALQKLRSVFEQLQMHPGQRLAV